jgi:uncharacterized protein
MPIYRQKPAKYGGTRTCMVCRHSLPTGDGLESIRSLHSGDFSPASPPVVLTLRTPESPGPGRREPLGARPNPTAPIALRRVKCTMERTISDTDWSKDMNWIWFTLLGLVAGGVSGLVGIGGGIIIVPALVILLGFSQKMAQGTTLALLVPPIGIFAALTYYRAGYVNLRAAGLIVLGFLVGSFLGARYVTRLSNVTVTRIFAVFLIVVAIRMLISAKP